MKINYSNQLNPKLTNGGGMFYEILGKTKYVASITNWNHAPAIVNAKTGLTIGYLRKEGFQRAWGFRKDLGKSGLVSKSIKN
jgi:hypothetical protein